MAKQKRRIYIPKGAYHITTNSQGSFPFFKEEIFCNIFLDVIANCRKIKPFELLGIKINPDHSHLVIQVGEDYNISQIMQHIKRVSSDNINQIASNLFEKRYNPYYKLEWTPTLQLYKRQYNRKYNYQYNMAIAGFKWQKSFDDKLIRTKSQLTHALNYLKKQQKKHNLPVNQFLYMRSEIPNDIVFIGEQK